MKDLNQFVKSYIHTPRVSQVLYKFVNKIRIDLYTLATGVTELGIFYILNKNISKIKDLHTV